MYKYFQFLIVFPSPRRGKIRRHASDMEEKRGERTNLSRVPRPACVNTDTYVVRSIYVSMFMHIYF